MKLTKAKILFFILQPICAVIGLGQTNNNIPHLVNTNGYSQLIVNQKPFLILGGELGNSSASSIEYMKPNWAKLKAMHLNAVLAPVYWELMEPSEGKFDFGLVDNIIFESRKNNLKVVFLWFGSWKNSMSCYVPSWAKTNTARFERAKDTKGNNLEIFSAFSKNNLDADIKAFRALMQHIKSVDEKLNTVLMVQVENEIGMLTAAREYTNEANDRFAQKVPTELIDYLVKNKEKLVPEFYALWQKNGFKTAGNWEAIFGEGLGTEEIFQAWYYGVFTNAVANAGKKEYNLPMYVNAALNYKNNLPGEYPSAGPLPHLMDIWQAAAPAIDILSPDFYNPFFRKYCDAYVRKNNPFFIPEIRFEPDNAAKAFYAIGHYKAFGFSPFSIESTESPSIEPLSHSYQVLNQLTPLILQQTPKGKVEGILLDSLHQSQEIIFGKYKLTVKHTNTLSWTSAKEKANWKESGGIIIQVADDEFYIAGTGIVVSFSGVENLNKIVGILQSDEGTFEQGKWIAGRRMNGDQDHQGRHVRIEGSNFGIQRVKLYEY